jgi:hypothetical protein
VHGSKRVQQGGGDQGDQQALGCTVVVMDGL